MRNVRTIGTAKAKMTHYPNIGYEKSRAFF
ncbi:hypothetical protein BMS3Bbin10_02474 [bacterium BMS3Bbin10]|nr:hypothetical protein BMS3Bbin10_02474 [bacterium BMS3Bbin10]